MLNLIKEKEGKKDLRPGLNSPEDQRPWGLRPIYRQAPGPGKDVYLPWGLLLCPITA